MTVTLTRTEKRQLREIDAWESYYIAVRTLPPAWTPEYAESEAWAWRLLEEKLKRTEAA